MKKINILFKRICAISLSSALAFSSINVSASTVQQQDNATIDIEDIETSGADNRLSIEQNITFDALVPETAQEAPAPIQEVNTMDDFQQEIVELNQNTELESDNTYASKRLIVTSDIPDFEAYNAENILAYGNLYVLSYASENETRKAYNALSKSSGIISVEVDSIVETSSIIGTEPIEEPESLDNPESLGGTEPMGNAECTEDITPDPVQETDTVSDGTERGTHQDGIKIAVVDSGIAKGNPLFEGKILDLGFNFSTSGEGIQDDNGHGTAVSSVIAANSDAYIMPIKITNSDGKGTVLGLYLAIQAAIENGADIINLSMTTSSSELLASAIEEADEAGIRVVAAAGNQSANVENYAPANIDSVIAVAAVDQNYSPASYSNYGSMIDYAAIGTDLEVETLYGPEVMSGTSLSAAYVSAVMAHAMENSKDFASYVYPVEGKADYYGKGIVSLEEIDLAEKGTVDIEGFDFKIKQSLIEENDRDNYKLQLLTNADVEYTFDGGRTWQESDYIEINRNNEFYDGNEYMSSIRSLGIRDIDGNTRFKDFSVIDCNNPKNPETLEINLEAEDMTETSTATGSGYYDSNGDSSVTYKLTNFYYDIESLTATLTGCTSSNTDTGRSSLTLTSTVYVKYNGTKKALTVTAIGNGTSAISMSLWGSTKGETPYTVKTVVIPVSVTSINGYAFYGLTDITTIKIGNSSNSEWIDKRGPNTGGWVYRGLETIGDYAFSGCSGLTKFGTYVQTFAKSMDNKTYARYIYNLIGGNVSTIGDYAFYGCDQLNVVTLGEGIADIGTDAFNYGSVVVRYPENAPEGSLFYWNHRIAINKEIAANVKTGATKAAIGEDDLLTSYKFHQGDSIYVFTKPSVCEHASSTITITLTSDTGETFSYKLSATGCTVSGKNDFVGSIKGKYDRIYIPYDGSWTVHAKVVANPCDYAGYTSSTSIDYLYLVVKEYAVTYHGNGATSGSTLSQVKAEDVTLALRDNGFSRTSYKFKEWNTKADGTGTSYAAGAGYTENADLTLYAIWESDTTYYTVQHWKQKIGQPAFPTSENFDLSDTQKFEDVTIGSSQKPAVKTYTGFASPSVQTVTVAANGATVVKYYYTRNNYTVTYIDRIKDTTTQLGTSSTASKPYGSTVRGADNGSDTTVGKYHTSYYYVSDTTATVTTSGATVYRYFSPQNYTVTYIDRIKDTTTQLGTSSTASKPYGSTVRGADKGSDTTIGKYHTGYYYVSDTSATVTTSGAAVYRYFSPQNYTVTYIDRIKGTTTQLGTSSTASKPYGSSVRGADNGSDTTVGKYYTGYYYVSDTSATVTTSGATVYRYFSPQNYTVTYIDRIKGTTTQLGSSSTASKPYGSTVRGSDKGSDTTAGKYHTGYYYVSDTSATVTTSGATVYRYFSPQNYTVTYIDVVDSISGKELGRSTMAKPYNSTVRGTDKGSSTADNAYHNGYYYVSDTSATVTTSGATVYRVFKQRMNIIAGNIIWIDWNNKNLSRPNSVNLYISGSDGSKYPYVITGDNSKNTSVNKWPYSKELPKYDTNGKVITYTVSQDKAVSKDDGLAYKDPKVDGYNVTNEITNEPDETHEYPIKVNVAIKWEDNNDQYGFRPNAITLQLLQNGTAIKTISVSSNYTFTELLKYDSNGDLYVYTIQASDEDRYTKSVNNTAPYSKSVTYTFIAPTYSVIIPKIVILDGSTGIGEYVVSVKGQIDDRDFVNVIPDKSFTMSNDYLSPITAAIKQNRTSFTNKENIKAGAVSKGTITTKSLAGRWSGSFNFNIYFEFGR